MNNNMNTTQIEKVCPFCEEVFSAKEIKIHIGVNHLDIPLEKIENDTSAKEVVDSPKIKSEPLGELSVNQTESKESKENPKKSFQCKICNKLFDSERRLKNHLQMMHEKKGKFACDQCPKVYPFKFKLKQHVNIVHLGKIPTRRGGKRYQCTQCKKSFTTKKSLKLHKRSFHEGKRYQCAQCDQSYAFPNDYRRHVRVKHEGSLTFRCELCDKNFTANFSLKMHNKQKHPHNPKKNHPKVLLKRLSKEIIESYIHKQPNEISNLTEPTRIPGIRLEKLSKKTIEMYQQSKVKIGDHEFNYDPESKIKEDPSKFGLKQSHLSCNFCGKTYKSPYAMKYHRRVVHESFRISCKICMKSFTAKHKLRVHPCKGKPSVETAKAKTHQCHRCSLKFTKKVDLKHHVLRVHEAKSIEKMELCELESNDQTTDQDVKDNENIFDLTLVLDLKDSDNKEMEVDKENIANHQNLQNHSFLCMHCNKRFKTRNHLVQHDRTVHQKKRYKADKPDQCSKQRLEKHPIKPYFECDQCEKKFKLKGKLDQHILIVHSKSINIKGHSMGWCEICQKVFGNLYQHQRNAHVNIFFSFECEHCGKKFKGKQRFNNHVKKCHSNSSMRSKEHCIRFD